MAQKDKIFTADGQNCFTSKIDLVLNSPHRNFSGVFKLSSVFYFNHKVLRFHPRN